jgi:hypothetical protein
MALNYNWQLIAEAGGSLNGNTCNLRLYAKLLWQSVSNNQSGVAYESRLYYGGSYFNTGSPSSKSIAGTGVSGQSADASGNYNGGETTLYTVSGTVTHNTNGNANISANASVNFGPWGYSNSVSGSASLPKINRVAVTNSVTGSDIEQEFKVNYTKYVNNYQYKLRISIPNVIALETIDYNTSGEQFTLSQSTIENLYSRFTTTNTFNLGFAVETWNGNTKLSAGNEKIISCKITGNTPIFTDFEYNDINPTTLALTGNSKYNINGYSTIRVLISQTNKAIAQKGATMVKYQLMIGSETKEIAYSDTDDVYIDLPNASIGEYKVYAIDSRNNSTLVTKLSLKNIEYKPLYIDKANSNTERDEGGIGENVTLNYRGTIWNDSFGQVNNAITIAKYEFKKVSDNVWITGTTNITPTISENSLSFSGLIRSNETGYIFPVQDSYNFRITLQDKLSTTIVELTPLPSGTPNISLNKNGVGIMCDYDENLGGDLQVGGEIFINSKKDEYSTSEVKTNKVWINGKPIYRKCFYVSSFPNNTSIWVATGISNIEQVTYTGGYGQNTNEVIVINSAYNTSYIDSLIYERAGTNAGKIRVHTISNRSAYSGYIWIEYTKTTD